MSADNFAIIAQHPDTGRWHVLQGFASDDEFNPLASWSRGWSDTREGALLLAERDYYEYGYSEGDWPRQWRELAECPTCEDLTLVVQRKGVR